MSEDRTMCPKCWKMKPTPEEARIIPEGKGDWLCWDEGDGCWLDDYHAFTDMAVAADRKATLASLRREADEIGGRASLGRAEFLRRAARELEQRWQEFNDAD